MPLHSVAEVKAYSIANLTKTESRSGRIISHLVLRSSVHLSRSTKMLQKLKHKNVKFLNVRHNHT